MIFKKMELQGFKTFFDRTEVHFRAGINAVVGPNGCGKSNIADAIRWVLGEQSPKQLRGEKMEDLIFSGSQNRHPLGMAEVALTVEVNGEELPAPYSRFTEICVTRRLYRSGESEFLINNTPCRLRDIRELFLDTGMNPKAYAVISQGSIGDIIKARPEDRRVLIEEAAGIAKFKERKNAALRKLDSTEQNLVRIGDLTRELKRQLGSLQRQAGKARRYHELTGQLEEAELTLLAHQHEALRERGRGTEERVRGLAELDETLRAEIASQEASLETGSLATVQIESELGGLREGFYSQRARLEALDTRCEAGRARIEALRAARSRETTEAERLAGVIADHGSERELLEAELSDLEQRLVERETAASESSALAAEAAAACRDLRTELDGATARLRGDARDDGESRTHLARLEARFETLGAELSRIAAETEALDHEDVPLVQREKDLAAELAGGRADRAETESALEAVSTEVVAAREEAGGAATELASAREDLGGSTSRLSSLSELERNLSGWPERFQEELEHILSHEELNGGLLGLLADRIQAAPEYENALEAVLGERLKCLLVRNPATAVQAAGVLRAGAAVRGTFLPVDPRVVSGEPPPPPPAGARSLLSAVTVPDDLRPVAAHLLRGVYLVDDLAAAAALWNGNGGSLTYVTPAGEVLWPDGGVTAGRLDPTQEILPLARSIRETQAAAAEAELRLAEAEIRAREARERLADLEERRLELAGRERSLEIQVAGLEKDLLLARQKRGAHAAQRDRLIELAGRAFTERETLHGHLARERERHCDLAAARDRRESEVATLEERLEAATEAEKSVRERLTELQVDLAGSRERRAHLSTRIEHLASGIVRAAKQSAELSQAAEVRLGEEHEAVAEADTLAAERAQLATERDRLEALLNEAQTRHRYLSGRARETEERLRGLRLRREEIQSERSGLQVQRAEEEVRREHLRGRVFEIRGAALEELFDEESLRGHLEAPQDDLAERHRSLAAQIQALGPVNLAALGDQEELRERLESQRSQQEDLEQASRNLRQAILKINATSREKYVETFERVNEKFQEVFPMLMEDGHALLRLSDTEDPLEAGIEILAQPAGKKLKHISLLSGGEQALTAISLLLAIFMVKPSPFCLLDEVDAPLDESNILRFLHVLRRSINGSQLVMITHNKRTMEHANHLVGVTMADPGVSRLITVALRTQHAQAS